MFKKIWELISNNRLLSALIVMAIGGFIKLFGPGLFSWLTKVLSVEYKNPLWLLILFHCLVAAILFIVLLLILRRRYATRHNPELTTKMTPEPDWKKYTEDDFIGMHWSWNYFGDNKYPNNLKPRCLQCHFPLENIFAHDVKGIFISFFKCPNEQCQYECDPFQGTQDNLFEKVRKQIDGNIYTGAYKQKIKNHKEDS